MRETIYILLILIPMQTFAQTTVLRTCVYKGTEYIVFPDPQKKDFNPNMYWTEKKGKQTVIMKYPKDGNWIQFFKEDTTQVAKIFQIINGLPHGQYKRYDFGGELKEEGEFFEGSRNGEWKMYDEFYEDGEYTANGSYKAIDSAYYKLAWEPYHYIKSYYGKNGNWTYRNEQGSIIKSEFYRNGQRDSVWTIYFSNGQRKTEKRYSNGKLDGVYKTWNETGKLLTEQNFKDGKRNGNYNEWYANGKTKCELTYENDSLINGKCTLYYDSGEKYAEGKLDDGVKIGEWTYYYKNGNIWAQGSYKTFVTSICMSAMPHDYYHSAMTSMWTFWNETGKKVAEGIYKPVKTRTSRGLYYLGTKTGSWKYWNADGIEVKEKNFTPKSVFELDVDKEK